MTVGERKRIAVRAYAVEVEPESGPERDKADSGSPEPTRRRSPLPPSSWSLVLAVRTRPGDGEQLMFGSYLLLRRGRLFSKGLFYDSRQMNEQEVKSLRLFAKSNGFKVMSRMAFIDKVFYPVVYRATATCIGYDLPFTLSRLAIHYGVARYSMHGGFSLQLRPEKWPRLRIKRLTRRAASINFASTSYKNSVPRYGYFADVRSIAGALFGDDWPWRSSSNSSPLTRIPSLNHQYRGCNSSSSQAKPARSGVCTGNFKIVSMPMV